MSRARGICAVALGVLALLAVRCYDPHFVSGQTQCSVNRECPSDWSCEGEGQAAVCVAPGGGTGGASAGTGGDGTGGSGTGGVGTGGGSATGTGGAVGSGGITGGGGAGQTGGTTSVGSGGSVTGTGGGATAGVSGGTGGTAGVAGVSGGAGRGASGGAGTGGAAGAGGAQGPTTCVMGLRVPPATALITDFSDATRSADGEVGFGTTMGAMGGTARWASTTKGTLAVVGGALEFSATVEPPTATAMYPFSGFGLYFGGAACVDATAYSGVAFSMSVTGNCKVLFTFSDADHARTTDDTTRGMCTDVACFPSQFEVTSTTTQVAFGATPQIAGQPIAAVAPGKLTGVEWQVRPIDGATTSCAGVLVVDNVRFY